MKSFSRGVLDLFGNERRYVIPMFQRPYVWSADRQWSHLWADIQRKALERHRWNLRIQAASADEKNELQKIQPAEHFLGAIVLDGIKTYGDALRAQSVIDGQQRLTTFHILLTAFRDVARELVGPDSHFTVQLQRHTLNDCLMDDPVVEKYKVWPTNQDQEAFLAIHAAGSLSALAKTWPALAKKHPGGAPRLAMAYAFFHSHIEGFLTRPVLGDGLAEQPGLDARINLLVKTLQNGFNLVSIELEGGDDPQIIFETLNARGEPLLPSDLLRNYLFWRASQRKEDIDTLYVNYWKRFDSEYWKALEKQGRLNRPRIDLYFSNYLQMKTQREINVERLFHEYKSWSEQVGRYPTTGAELEDISHYAAAYESLRRSPTISSLADFSKFLDVFDVKTVMPVLLRILGEKELLVDERDGMLQDIESYLVRRAVCGLTAKNYNNVFVAWLARIPVDKPLSRELLRKAMKVGVGEAAVWPDDSEFKEKWLNQPVYQKIKPAAKLEYILKRLEIAMRTNRHESVSLPGKLTIEHVMPESWYEHWPLADGTQGKDATARMQPDGASPQSVLRDQVVHTFGNLTLLTGPANSSLQNFPIDSKVKGIDGYSLLAMNKHFSGRTSWDEADIRQRAITLFEFARVVWPYPSSPAPEGAVQP